MQEDPEWRITLDVPVTFAAAERAVAAVHSYDVPMIIAPAGTGHGAPSRTTALRSRRLDHRSLAATTEIRPSDGVR